MRDGGDIENVVIGTPRYVDMSYSTGNPSSKRSTREKLEGAADYLRRYSQWEIDKRSNKDLKEPSKSGVDENYVRDCSRRAEFPAGSVWIP